MHDKYIKSDEMILAIQRERDEFARKSKEIRMKESEEKIREREEKISEREVMIDKRESKIDERESKIDERESKIDEREEKINEKERELENIKKSIVEEKRTEDKKMVIKYTFARFHKDISEEMKNIDDERLELLKSKIFYLDSIDDIIELINL